ncbi:alpha-L-rhamnosidase [Cohnella zeiphila]|uniref:alpha-L-rhamnosidase n=1 Tax=Cohnella zeiphila TaxID=2761120 RepID=A0A7X0VUJ6_9BACL|nr:alpha-L-rhamnosidase [Cohnella zeiphila]MBB6731016.1 family 78 glycoside hydrolase catalytic domain [Cohnella zeiphila]
MRIVGMKVEGREHPLGLDCPAPGFGWSYEESAERSVLQSAYRIRVYSDEAREAANDADVWDSGKRDGRDQASIVYEGSALQSGTRYYWRVTVWDQKGRSRESGTSWWETGLLHEADWQGVWIGAPEGVSGSGRPLPLLRREFAVRPGLRSARAYVCGLGHYELRLNGAKVGERELEPGWTQYDQTCLYSVYDVSDCLTEGDNAAGILLGNGFYHVEGGRYAKFKGSFGRPKCLVQLELRYEDGKSETIASDESWSVTEGPIAFSCIYGGEDYDARREQPGWDRPGFVEDGRWTRAAAVPAPRGTLRSQHAQPLKVMRRFEPLDVKRTKSGARLVDFGQNFSGWTEIAVAGPAGSTVTLIPGERLTDDGEPDQRMSGSPYRLSYTLKGDGEERWRPRFTYYGFRYVLIEGAAPLGDGSREEAKAEAEPQTAPAEAEPQADSTEAEPQATLLGIEGQMIYPDIATTGAFRCSDPMLERIHEIINRAILSNTKSVFTDCPHREKLGWLEQVHLMGPSILYNYDAESLFAKVMDDIRDAQQPNGMVPTIAPEYVVFQPPWDMFRDSVSWGAAYVLTSLELLRRCGHSGSMRKHYDGMKRYAEYVFSRLENGLVPHGLGDWYDVGEDGPGFAQNTPVPLVETAMLYAMLTALGEIARLQDRREDAARYAERQAELKRSFNAAYSNAESGLYAGGSQTAQAMPLALGLVEPEQRRRVLGVLVRDIEAKGSHTTAGDIGHRFVLAALAENGRSDVIYRMTRQTDHPSYGYQLAHGATTLTEAWDGPTVGKSQNHFMLGHIEEWLYKGLAGIDPEFEPSAGAVHIRIKPAVVGDLRYVDAHCATPAGRVAVRWERLGEDGLRLRADIPANARATVHVPAVSPESAREEGAAIASASERAAYLRYEDGCAVFAVGSGTYAFESAISPGLEPQSSRMEGSA